MLAALLSDQLDTLAGIIFACIGPYALHAHREGRLDKKLRNRIAIAIGVVLAIVVTTALYLRFTR
jgi:hypothetical protein